MKIRSLPSLCTSVVLTFAAILFVQGCGSGLNDKVSDAIDIADGVPEKDIDRSKLGVNAFFNDSRFGSIGAQYSEISSTLGIRRVRILLNWDNNVQPSPSSAPNFGFYDAILGALPSGMDALVILTGAPSWMSDPANWIDGNPRRTFVEKWVRPVTRRYSGNGGIVGWQIWNEPNQLGRPDNIMLQLDTSPTNFVELVSLAHDACKDANRRKLVLNGATTAINQNFSGTLDYNKAIAAAGIYNVVDVFAIHYYGRQFENVLRSGGVKDFLNSVPKRIWVTESGAQGTMEQLRYVRQVYPFLTDEVPTIDRFYYYQMYEASDPKTTYGLRNPSASAPLSDLYVSLRDDR